LLDDSVLAAVVADEGLSMLLLLPLPPPSLLASLVLLMLSLPPLLLLLAPLLVLLLSSSLLLPSPLLLLLSSSLLLVLLVLLKLPFPLLPLQQHLLLRLTASLPSEWRYELSRGGGRSLLRSGLVLPPPPLLTPHRFHTIFHLQQRYSCFVRHGP
jgi:hypothetical protein